jgi:hypothetical protein
VRQPPRTFAMDAFAAWSPYWELSMQDIAAVLVLGGNVEAFFGGSSQGRMARDLLERAAKEGKILGGIGDGAALLADAGFLQGRRAAVQPRFADALRLAGAEVVSDGPVLDGNMLTAESNFSMRALVGHLPEKPVVLALVAERDFWFDDFRAAKFEVERVGGVLLTVSTTTAAMTPNKAGGGDPIVPDLLLPLLRYDDRWHAIDLSGAWPSGDLGKPDLSSTPVERFALDAKLVPRSRDESVPGINAELVGPRRSSQR